MSARDPWLDNAKMALVTLVVVGHAWTLGPGSPLHDQLYDFLYSWHMPAFVFISGYLSRGFTWSGPKLAATVRTLLVPYLLFEAAIVAFRIHVGHEKYLIDLFIDPHWPIWFLVALVIWRLVTPLARVLPGAVLAAVGVCLLGGLMSPETATYLDLARVIGFLPFYVLGVKTTPERLELLRRPAVRVGAVVVLVVALVASRFLDDWSSTGWYYYSSYDALGASGWEAVGLRLATLGVGLVSGLAFLAVIPRRGGWFAQMGSATLVVYCFHGFFIKDALYRGVTDWATDHPTLSPFVLVAAAVALALGLACRPVAQRLDVVVDPFGHARERVDDAVALSFAAARGPIDLASYDAPPPEPSPAPTAGAGTAAGARSDMA